MSFFNQTQLYMNKTLKKIIFFTVGILITASAVEILCIVDPRTVNILPKCIFYQLTSLHCPGCGNTRALYHLIHGEFLLSVRNNCLLIPAIILLTILMIFPKLALKKSICYTVLAITVLFFILRNIPMYPFSLLAPI